MKATLPLAVYVLGFTLFAMTTSEFMKRDVTVEEVNAAFKQAAESGPLQGILGYSDEPLVSSDYQGDARSSIIDGLSTLVIGGNLVKILAWYDNEWAFSNRLVDLAVLMDKQGL